MAENVRKKRNRAWIRMTEYRRLAARGFRNLRHFGISYTLKKALRYRDKVRAHQKLRPKDRSEWLAGPNVYRERYTPQGKPKVSILIPSCDHTDYLERCLVSIAERSTYDNYEIIVIENNSKKFETFAYYKAAEQRWQNLSILEWKGPFNWAAINNYGVREKAAGEQLLFLNNDVEVITPQWIEEMLAFTERADVGAAGAMLYYPDDTIQHAGVALGIDDGPAGHMFHRIPRKKKEDIIQLNYAQNLTAVTGACMLTRREVFEQVGGFDESFTVGLNDVDYCMRIRREGYLVVWTPFAELYHYESISRGYDDTSGKKARADRETALFEQRWAEEIAAGSYDNVYCERRRYHVG